MKNRIYLLTGAAGLLGRDVPANSKQFPMK